MAILATACWLALVAVPASVLGADGQVRLILRPLYQKDSYFDLVLEPGETRSLSVEIGNAGGEAMATRTYAADVYTIVNGGFGARLRSDPKTGITGWLDYSTEVLLLPSAKAIDRTFAVSVPAATQPGEYITSLVVENDQAVSVGGAVVLNQFVRQAIAVVVTVPGPRTPVLAIREASHSVVAGKSVVAVAVDNLGNIRLKPSAAVIIADASGAEVSQRAFSLDSFYAATGSSIEVPLAALLRPGTYTVHLVLDDAVQAVRAEATRTFVVDPPADPPAVGAAPGLVGVNQAPVGPSDLPLWIVGIAGGLVGAIAIGSLTLLRRLRTRTDKE